MSVRCLTSLKMRAFRSYAKLDLEPQSGIIALAGPNGAGKTNILEAISMLSPGRGLRRAQPEALARTQNAVGWSVAAELTGNPDPISLWTGADMSARRTAKIDDKTSSVLALGRKVRIVWLTPALDRVFVDGPGERRRFLDRLTLSLFPHHAEQTARFEKAMRERNRLLKDGANDARWYNALEDQMARAGVAIGKARREALTALMAHQTNDSAFPKAKAALTGEFEVHLDADDPVTDYARRLNEERPLDIRAGRSLEGPHRSDLEVIFAEKKALAATCSTGEQKALLVSLVLANARALASEDGSPPILLLDEIAAHFDADRRAALFDEINALGAQAWLTGTEWSLFDSLSQNATRLSVSETEAGSTISYHP